MEVKSDNELEDPLEAPPTAPEPSTEQANNEVSNLEGDNTFASLGKLPTDAEALGEDLHEEIVIRWKAYLKKGLPEETKKELMVKHPLPKNCTALKPPKLNSEIAECLPEIAINHDLFITAVQKQMGHALSSIGSHLQKLITSNRSEEVSNLADAAQLLTNAHQALSTHRRFKIMPHLNPAFKKAIHTTEIDDYLFGEKLGEALKAGQEMRRTVGVIKKRPEIRSWPKPIQNIANKPSTSRQVSNTHHLNSQPPLIKTRMKTGRGGEQTTTSTRRKRTEYANRDRNRFKRHY